MRAIKRSPREETANRYLLRRAERIYQELPLEEQNELGSLLDGFEAALEMADKEVIGPILCCRQGVSRSPEAPEDDSP